MAMVIKINEIFYSLQGEGILSGAPTIFIRTTGCNLRCDWCDSEYAYEEGEDLEIDGILERAKKLSQRSGCTRACVTGGEPLLHDEMPELVFRLLSSGYHVTIETNGSQSLPTFLQYIHNRSMETGGEREGQPVSAVIQDPRENLITSLDIKCPSSGEDRKMDLRNLNLLGRQDHLKFVVKDLEDIHYAFRILEQSPVLSQVVIQPVMGEEIDREQLGQLADAFLSKAQGRKELRFMLQSHKIIWGDSRGV